MGIIKGKLYSKEHMFSIENSLHRTISQCLLDYV